MLHSKMHGQCPVVVEKTTEETAPFKGGSHHDHATRNTKDKILYFLNP